MKVEERKKENYIALIPHKLKLDTVFLTVPISADQIPNISNLIQSEHHVPPQHDIKAISSLSCSIKSHYCQF